MGLGHGLFNWVKMRMNTNRMLVVVVLLGIFIRLLFIGLYPRLDDENVVMDSHRFTRVAVSIVDGRGFSEYRTVPALFTPPIYPYLIALIFKFFNYSILLVKILQAILGGLVCWIIYRIGALLFDSRVGIVAAILIAICPELIGMTGYLYTETIYIFLSTLAVLYLVRTTLENERIRYWVLAGVILGLSFLTKQILILFPFFYLGLVSLFRKKRTYLKRGLIMMVVCYGMIIPWTVRNYIVSGEFLLIATGGMHEFWIGTNSEYDGRFRYGETWERELELTRDAENDVEKDRILFKKALQNIVNNPLQYGVLVVKKFFRYFFQIYENVPAGEARRMNIIVVLLLGMSYYPILIMGVTGIVLSRHQCNTLLPIYGMILYSSLLHSFTHVVPRYRIPILPFLIIFTSVGLCDLGRRIHRWWRSRYLPEN